MRRNTHVATASPRALALPHGYRRLQDVTPWLERWWASGRPIYRRARVGDRQICVGQRFGAVGHRDNTLVERERSEFRSQYLLIPSYSRRGAWFGSSVDGTLLVDEESSGILALPDVSGPQWLEAQYTTLGYLISEAQTWHPARAECERSLESFPPVEAPTPQDGLVGAPTHAFLDLSDASSEGEAQLSADVPIRLPGVEGAFVGYLRTGQVQRVSVTGNDIVVDAALPGCDESGAFRRRELVFSFPRRRLRALIPRTFTEAAIQEVRALRESPVIGAGNGLHRELSAQPGARGFAFLECGPYRILERKNGALRVAAEFEAGVLVGWIDAPEPGEQDPACTWKPGAPTGPGGPIPAGYVAVDTLSTDLGPLLRKPTRFFRKQPGKGCEALDIIPTGHGKGHFIGERPSIDTITPRRPSTYEIRGNGFVVTEYLPTQHDSSFGLRTKRRYFAVVRIDSDRWSIIENADEGSIVAYHPQAPASWFRSKMACEAADEG